MDWHPGLSIYASPAFLRTTADEIGWLGGFDRANQLRCILPFTVIKKLFFRLVRFRVETIATDQPLSAEEEKSFLEEAMKFFRARGATMVIPASTNTLFQTFPAGAIAAPYGSYIVDLTAGEDVLWKNLHSKHRNVIRNAQKAAVEIDFGRQHLEAAHELITATLRRSRMPFLSLPKLKQLADSLGPNLEVAIARHQGTLQACAILPFSGYGAYYLYGGTREKPVTGAMNLLQWETMRRMYAASVARYDFVGARVDPEKGSKQEGLAMFKARFGGQFHRGYIWKFSFHRFSYAIYQVVSKFSRGGDIVDQEYERRGLGHNPTTNTT